MNKDTQSWSNSNLTEMEELLQKTQQLQRENAELRNELASLKHQTQWECSCGGTDCEGQKENAALRKLVQHWYKLVPQNIRSSIEDAQKEAKP